VTSLPTSKILLKGSHPESVEEIQKVTMTVQNNFAADWLLEVLRQLETRLSFVYSCRMALSWDTAAQGHAGLSPGEVDFFQFIQSFQPHYGPGVGGASNRNENQESSWGIKGGRLVRPTILLPSMSLLSRENMGDNFTAIYAGCLEKIWEPRRLTFLWAFTACYARSFTFLLP
jgi:hypothetical protein